MNENPSPTEDHVPEERDDRTTGSSSDPEWLRELSDGQETPDWVRHLFDDATQAEGPV
jgi:hypothetical protein